MFMTYCDLVYGRNTSTQSNNTAAIASKADSESFAEKGKGMETAAKAAKAFLGAHVAAAKFAGGAVSKLSKKAVDYAKSEDAAEKMDLVKSKAGAAFASIKGKAAALAAERKKSSDKKFLRQMNTIRRRITMHHLMRLLIKAMKITLTKFPIQLLIIIHHMSTEQIQMFRLLL